MAAGVAEVGQHRSTHVDGDDVRPLGGEAPGQAPPLAPGGPGDEHDLSLEAPHRSPLRVRLPSYYRRAGRRLRVARRGAMTDALDDFTLGSFSYRGVSHDVFRRGAGPAVIVIAEIPGITPTVADFARRVVDLGCTVVLPVLFGEPGRRGVGRVRRVVAHRAACVSKEFAAFATRQDGTGHRVAAGARPLRARARAAGPGVGAVGMCFTGGFALGDDGRRRRWSPRCSASRRCRFAVLEEGQGERPALATTTSPRSRSGSPTASACSACASPATGRCPPSASRPCAGSSATASSASRSTRPRATRTGIRKRAHSVLTGDLVDEPGHPTREALDQVLEFFRSRLVEPAAG